MKAKLEPPYTTLTQQPFCCVPACIQMVLYRRGLSLLEQEEIGIDLGLTVPLENGGLFENVPTLTKPPTDTGDWGTRINIKKYDLNSFFKKRGFHLRSTYVHQDKIKEVPFFIASNLEQRNDILTCFRYGTLYNENVPHGHGSLIEKINGTQITLVEPMADLKRKSVSVDKLIEAIIANQEKNHAYGGFWVIQSET